MKALRTSGRPARQPAKKRPAAHAVGREGVKDLSVHATGTTIIEKAIQASAGTPGS